MFDRPGRHGCPMARGPPSPPLPSGLRLPPTRRDVRRAGAHQKFVPLTIEIYLPPLSLSLLSFQQGYGIDPQENKGDWSVDTRTDPILEPEWVARRIRLRTRSGVGTTGVTNPREATRSSGTPSHEYEWWEVEVAGRGLTVAGSSTAR